MKGESDMFVILSEVAVKRGFGEQALQFYQAPGEMEKSPGFVGIDFLKVIGGADAEDERYVGYTRWETKELFQSWMKSEAYRQSASAGMPDFVTDHKITLCELLVSKEPVR